MRAELIHTSVPKGLDGGSGFAVAARTGGMPRALADTLGSLSGLPEAWPGASDEARTLRATRAVAWQGTQVWVASVIQACGVDHTGRGNRIAHHRVLDADEVSRLDPVAVLREASWLGAWKGEPREIDSPAPMEVGQGHAGPCARWAKAFGDAGVAAAALERAFRSGVGAWIVVPAGSDREALLQELAGLLPLANRWKRGWSTRPLRPAADDAPVICVVDAQEPEVQRAPAGAPWCIHADSLRADAAEGLLQRAREGAVTAQARGVKQAGSPMRVSIAPPSRLAVPGDEVPDAADTETPIQDGERTTSAPLRNVPIEVVMTPAARSRAWIWIVLALAVLGGAAWLLVRGGAA